MGIVLVVGVGVVLRRFEGLIFQSVSKKTTYKWGEKVMWHKRFFLRPIGQNMAKSIFLGVML